MLNGLTSRLNGLNCQVSNSNDSSLQVKTELVLKSLRDGNQGEHPRVLLDTFFLPPEQGGILDPLELDRSVVSLTPLLRQHLYQMICRYDKWQMHCSDATYDFEMPLLIYGKHFQFSY